MNKKQSRLQRIEEKRAIKATIKYIFLTVVVVFFLFKFGFLALSKISSFITSFSKYEENNEDTAFVLPPPELISLPNFTNEKKLHIKGSAKPGYTIFIFLNGEKNELLANANGEFAITFELSNGENTIYAYASYLNQKSQNTQTYIVNYDKTPPKVEIIEPEEGKTFTGKNNLVKIEGQTEPNAKLTINDRLAIVHSDGKFSFATTLKEGENTFLIISQDRAGNKTETKLTINYSP